MGSLVPSREQVGPSGPSRPFRRGLALLVGLLLVAALVPAVASAHGRADDRDRDRAHHHTHRHGKKVHHHGHQRSHHRSKHRPRHRHHHKKHHRPHASAPATSPAPGPGTGTPGSVPSPPVTPPADPAPTTPPAHGPTATPVPDPAPARPAGWITTADGSRRVAALSAAELEPSAARSAVRVPVDAGVSHQQMDGFGAALTESAAHLIMRLDPEARTALLRAFFDHEDGAGMDLVRLPLGASDFALSHYTYDDMPPGRTDPTLAHFSLDHEEAEVLPVLREAVRINPDLRVMATPWSAPAWMKTSGSLIGGTLAADRVDDYARYLVRTVQELRGRGVPVRFLTLGNEPKHSPADYPGMLMSPAQQAELASAVSSRMLLAGLADVRLIGYDHNWDDTAFPSTLITHPAARSALAGTAFHCYAGNPAAQDVVHDVAPEKGIWFTECSGGAWAPQFAGNLGWNAHQLLIGATRHWARSVLLWNLALDRDGGPHTGGCGSCRGVVTIDPATGSVDRNVEYDVLALAGKAVRPGAVRIGTPPSVYGVETVAYRNPDGSHSLIAYNSWRTDQALVVDAGPVQVGAPLPAGSVVTLTW